MVRSSSTKTSKEKKTETARPSKSGSGKAVASKTVPVSKSAADSSKTKSPAKKTTAIKTKAAPAAKTEAVKASTSSRRTKANETAQPLKSKSGLAKAKSPKPQTLELFEHVSVEQDTPVVSVLPALSDEPIDPNMADIEAKTPPEFRDAVVPHFSDALPTGLETKGTEGQTEPKQEVTFSYLGFNDLILEAIRKQKFDKPTRVQALCLPFTLDGKDVAGFAQTGTGKTAVYLLTAAHKLLSQENRQVQPHKPHVLVVVPTRELADQVSQDAKRLLGSLQLKSIAVFGGVDVERHVSELSQAVDLVVATPGRLLDLHRSKRLELDDIQLLVIDECDRMFDMGFIDDVEYILRHLPTERVQKLLFSATGSEKVKELAFEYLEEPEYIETDPVSITPEKITQVAYAVSAEQKFLTLMGHLKANNPECAIIFTNTKVVAEWVGYKLACNGLNAEVLTGDLPQRKRMSLIKKIKEGKCSLLVATDVLSRGLHVANLSHVYNFDIPDDEESFIHRIGRTARAGATGHAITLICDDYGYNMGAVEKLLGFSIPLEPVPSSYLQAEDTSDYPFDSSGRVKVFGQTHEAAGQEGEESSFEAPQQKRHEKRDDRPAAAERGPRSERPESTLPHHRRDAGRGAQTERHAAPRPQQEKHIENSGPIAAAAPVSVPVAAHSRPVDGPQPVSQRPSTAAPQTHAPHQGPVRSAAPHAAGPSAPAARPTHAVHSNTTSTPRRDEKAKETIEMAIQAAKKAAARRQGGHGSSGSATTPTVKKHGKTRVTEQIDEIAAAVLTGAQEKLGGAFGNLQDRFVSRLEENFPRLSETLVRLGFFSKRFTDDR